MAIPAENIERACRDAVESSINWFEQQIDYRLAEDYRPDGYVTYELLYRHASHDEVRDALVHKYTQAGWRVHARREGDGRTLLTFSITVA